MAANTVQYMRETIKQRANNIEPQYNIRFDELQSLYRKATLQDRVLSALADAFIYGYAMGQKAARKETIEEQEKGE